MKFNNNDRGDTCVMFTGHRSQVTGHMAARVAQLADESDTRIVGASSESIT